MTQIAFLLNPWVWPFGSKKTKPKFVSSMLKSTNSWIPSNHWNHTWNLPGVAHDPLHRLQNAQSKQFPIGFYVFGDLIWSPLCNITYWSNGSCSKKVGHRFGQSMSSEFCSRHSESLTRAEDCGQSVDNLYEGKWLRLSVIECMEHNMRNADQERIIHAKCVI